MEKQVNSNPQEKQGKYNQTSIFLSRFIFGEGFDMLKKVGFMNSYTSDPEVMNILTLGENQRLLFLLFRNKKMNLNDLKKIITEIAQIPIQVVFSYELVNDYCMVVIDFPEKYILDYDNVTVGKYSKLTDSFKEKFPITVDVLNSEKKYIGKEYTLYYHIFNKTNWLKDFWMEKLGLCEIDDKLELWEKPSKEDLVFDIKNIISTK